MSLVTPPLHSQMTSLRCSSKNRDQILFTWISTILLPNPHQYFVHSFLIQLIPSVCHFISCYTFHRYEVKLLDLNLTIGGIQNFPWISKLSPLKLSVVMVGVDMDVVFPTMRHCDITDHSDWKRSWAHKNQLSLSLGKIP